MNTTILFNSDKFIKIAFVMTIGDFDKIVIAGSKEIKDIKELEKISRLLVDYEVIKDDFGVVNTFITEKQKILADKLGA